MKRKILPFLLPLLLIPVCAFAQSAVIGQDNVFDITPLTILTSGTPEAAVHNYFFTLEIFYGMVALFIRLCLRVLKL